MCALRYPSDDQGEYPTVKLPTLSAPSLIPSAPKQRFLLVHHLSSSASIHALKFQWLPIAARWVLLLLPVLGFGVGLGGYVFS